MLGCLAGPAPVGERLALLPYSAAAAAGFEPARRAQEIPTPPQRPRKKTPEARSPEPQLLPPGPRWQHQPLSQPPLAQLLEELPIPPPPPATERPPAASSSDATADNEPLQNAEGAPVALSASRLTPSVQTIPVGAPALAEKFRAKSGCGPPPFRTFPGGSTPPPRDAAAAATMAKAVQWKSPPTAAAAISTPVQQGTAPAAGSGPFVRIMYYNITIASMRIADQTE